MESCYLTPCLLLIGILDDQVPDGDQTLFSCVRLHCLGLEPSAVLLQALATLVISPGTSDANKGEGHVILR